jgi:predicted PurR-regulated permease PerM
VLPAVWVCHQVGKQAAETFETTKKEAEQGHWREMLERNPRVEPILSWIEQQIDFKGELDRVGKAVGERLPRFARGIIDFSIQLMIMFFLLFYFFRDRDIVLKTVSSLGRFATRCRHWVEPKTDVQLATQRVT